MMRYPRQRFGYGEPDGLLASLTAPTTGTSRSLDAVRSKSANSGRADENRGRANSTSRDSTSRMSHNT